MTYTGEALLHKNQSAVFGLKPYLPSPNLVKAVNLAILLKRPLLLKGEPGCGKSRLAEAIAVDFFKEDFRNFYFRWDIKSVSKARDGLYVIDQLQRLQDANFEHKAGEDLRIELDQHEDGSYKTDGKYIKLGKLGEVFQLTNRLPPESPPPVILIDEIDKADMDFPNDLLLELDKMEFEIPEAAKDKNGKTITIRANDNIKPLFIITSNDEKQLPPAFLRRCIFHYIDFKEIKLAEIVERNYDDADKELIGKSITKFGEWRKKIDEQGSSNKNISTSELLDWMELIIHFNKSVNSVPAEFVEDGLPLYYQALLKDTETIQLFVEKKKAEIKN